jgi:predicted TIM-barrel fold metal-dependent hydrolase
MTMASPSGGTVSTVDDLSTVVDADAHVIESLDDLLPYVEHTGSKEILSHSSNEVMDVYSNQVPTPGFIDRSYDIDDWQDKLDEMAEFNIDAALLGPTMSLNIASVNNAKLAGALAQGYNSWLLDEWLDDAEPLYGSILVTHHRPERSAEEIDNRAHEDAMRGVYFPGTGCVPPAGHYRYEPIYEAAQRHGLPILSHASISAGHRAFPVQSRWNETYAEEHAIVHPFTQMWNITTLLFRGIPERYPDLEFVFQEAGLAWIPYLVWRLDDHYLQFSDELPYLEKLPSEYIRDQFYFTTQPLGHTADNGTHLAQICEMIGTDSILYSADLPHTDFDPPEELLQRIRGHFDAETVRGIMGETAADFFELDEL